MLKRVAAGASSAAAALGRLLPDLIREVAGYGGVALLAYGAWMVYPPAGFIVAGALLLIGSLLAVKGR